MPPGLPWRTTLPVDAIAGLTTAAVVLPKAMAYATIAGLPVQVGLYTAVVPMVVYAFLGTSRPLSVSTTTTLAILTAAELGKVAPDGAPERLVAAAATLALLTGVFLLLAASSASASWPSSSPNRFSSDSRPASAWSSSWTSCQSSSASISKRPAGSTTSSPPWRTWATCRFPP